MVTAQVLDGETSERVCRGVKRGKCERNMLPRYGEAREKGEEWTQEDQ